MSPDKPISIEEKLVATNAATLSDDVRQIGYGNTGFRDLVSRSVLELARKKAEDLESQIGGFVDSTKIVTSANSDIEPLSLQEYLALRRQFKRAELEYRTLQTEDSRLLLEVVRAELTNFLVTHPELGRFNFALLVKQLEELRSAELQIISDIRAGKYKLVDGQLVMVESDNLVPEADRHLIIKQYIQSSTNQLKLNSLYQTLGMAQMIILGDWSVDRLEGVSAALGVESLAKIEAAILNFHSTCGSLKRTEPIVDSKLVHVHLGPGNGILMESLRREESIDPFNNGRLLNDYFQEIGYGDKIYFTLNSLLTKYVKSNLSLDDKKVINEFIYVISTLILRSIHYGSKFGLHNTENALLQLPKDINSLRKILLNLGSHIRNLSLKKKIKADKEFLSDETLDISPACLDLLAIFNPEIENAEQEVKEFYDKFFEPTLFDDSEDLSKHITMWGQNVIFGRFEDFDNVFPAEPSIDLGHSVRGTSHLDDKYYISLMGLVASRLKPGGIYIDDGIRESYTRFLRINKIIPHGGLIDLETKLGPEFRLFIVISDDNPKSLYIERGLPLEDGTFAFFSDYAKSTLALPGSELCSLNDFYHRMPEVIFRNQVLDRVKRVFVTQTLAEKEDEKVRIEKIRLGRSRFNGVHQRIEQLLVNFFNTDIWRKVREETGNSVAMDHLLDSIWSQVMDIVPEISKQDFIIRNKGLVPSQRTSVISTYPTNGDNEALQVQVSRLPRNANLPSIENLKDEVLDLKSVLSQLAVNGQARYGAAFRPIKVLEFGSFTDKIARSFFRSLFGSSINEYVEFVKVDSSNLDDIKTPQEGSIYYFGGSEIELATLNKLEIDTNSISGLLVNPNIRIIGSGFGHQLLLGTYGHISGSTGYAPEERELYFGPYEVEFMSNPEDSTNVGFDLAGKRVSVPFVTNSAIHARNHHYDADVQVSATLTSGNEPVVIELFDKRVLSSQPNLELSFSNPADVKALIRFMAKNIAVLDSKFKLPFPGNSSRNLQALSLQLRPQATNKFGYLEPWIQRDFGLPLIVSTLNRQAKSLLDEGNDLHG